MGSPLPVPFPPASPTRVPSVPPAALPTPASPPETPAGSTTPPSSLIRLDRPFDVDEFANLLGETTIRVTVPRESLTEVLRRVTDFMGFGIYVYSILVRPAPTDLLAGFIVELQRVDFSAERRAWVPFVEKGVADSPFGSTGKPP